MASRTATHSLHLDLPVKSVPLEISLSVSSTRYAGLDRASSTTQTVQYALRPPRTRSEAYPLAPPARPASSSYPLRLETRSRDIPTFLKGGRADTFAIEVMKDAGVKTYDVPAAPDVSRATTAVECTPPEGVKTFSSPYLENAPITRHALDRKHIPYPKMTDYMGALAERNGASYTDIKLIGVFDPVPVHYAKNFVIDTERGILKFNVRKNPVDTAGRRFVRIVYARRRSTGDIIYAFFPLD